MSDASQLRTAHLVVVVASLAALCGGCTGGGSLADTSWSVVEIHGKTDADQAAIADVKSIFVEFMSDGRLRTSVKKNDGSLDREDGETYKVEGNTLIVRHPNYERRLTITRTGDTMQVSSEKFNAKLERYLQPETSQSQPAMFRPSSVGRGQYRSVSTSAGRR